MFDRLFSPIRIGAVEVPNRIVRTAHATAFSRGPINDELIAYHLERARGGVGLSIIEGASVHPSSTFALSVRDDSVIPQYRRLVQAIAPTGMKLFQQLWHGGYTDPAANGGPPWAASALPGRYSMAPPIAMSTDQIGELINAYAKAAARVEEAGAHGVEILAGNGYLYSQFLSPVLNRRLDEYGGTFENRIRFLLETLQAIRSATSSGFALGIRIGDSSDQRILSSEDVNAVALRVQSEGLIDYLNITHGDYYFHVDRYAGMDQPVGYQLPFSGRIGQGITVPKIIIGRYATLDDAEQALRAGDADLVNMVRATIADPMLVAKGREGRASEIRPCIGCNQGCIGGVFAGRMSCTVNPAVGFEATLSEENIVKASSARRVFVIGGGPAGMEAARVALLYGHHVTLAEAAPNLGGMLNHAKRLPKLQAIGDIGIWLESELYRLGADVRLSTYMDAADVIAEAPDVVVVATGSQPTDPRDILQVADPATKVTISPNARVITSFDLFSDRGSDLGRSAMVFDDVGHYEAIGCCEELIGRGLAVTYVTRHLMFAPAIEVTGRAQAALRRLYSAGRFRVVTQAELLSIEDDHAEIRPIFGCQSEAVPADTVVIVAFRQAQNELWHALRGRFQQLHLVGDAISPRDLQPAIREGHLAARAIM